MNRRILFIVEEEQAISLSEKRCLMRRTYVATRIRRKTRKTKKTQIPVVKVGGLAVTGERSH